MFFIWKFRWVQYLDAVINPLLKRGFINPAFLKNDQMKKIQLFAAAAIDLLQSDINEWLATNKDVQIISTNIASLAKVSVLGSDRTTEGEYAFYILYTVPDEMVDHELMAAYHQMPSGLPDPGVIESEIN
mgnify:CR=1 FL=1